MSRLRTDPGLSRLRSRSNARGVCKHCGRGVLWVEVAGRPHPFDLRQVRALSPTGDLISMARVSHHDTCGGAAAPAKQGELGLSSTPVRTWPSGTDPWVIIDQELAPAYEAEERELEGTGAWLAQVLRLEGDPACVEIRGPADKAMLRRFCTYRVLGVPVIMITREQLSPAAAWIRRHKDLLPAVRARIQEGER